MPHTTHEYPFEAKVGGWAARTSERLTGRPAGFVLVLGPGGETRALHHESEAPDFMRLHEALEARAEPHIFYDPLEDGAEYVWLSWQGVERPVMERLIGAAFEPADFVSMRTGSRVAYPTTWGVMF